MITTPQPQQSWAEQQPPQVQPQQYGQPPRKHKVWPWVLLSVFVVFALLFAGCVAFIGGAANEISKGEGKRTTARPVGAEVRDGRSVFRVTTVDPPVSTVGDNQFLKKDAQGEYVLVHVEVTNTGDRSQSYFGGNQKLVDDQGRLYTNDTAAELNVNKDIHAEINPGNKISVVIVFDVPTGTVPSAIEFHDSMLSGGARVALK